MYKLKSQKREEKRRKAHKHKVSGSTVKKLARLIEEKGGKNVKKKA